MIDLTSSLNETILNPALRTVRQELWEYREYDKIIFFQGDILKLNQRNR